MGLVGEKRYTYADYLHWTDGQRYELIDGIVYNKPYISSRYCQQISGAVHNQFYNYLSGKKYRIYFFPLDVRLADDEKDNDEDIMTVVKPELFICKENKVDERGCKGVPELIIEISSSELIGRDGQLKRNLYERYGVREYWVVDYNKNTVTVYLLNKNKQYSEPEIYTIKDIIHVSIFNNLSINLGTVFKL